VALRVVARVAPPLAPGDQMPDVVVRRLLVVQTSPA